MNSPVMLWVILEEQRMQQRDPRRHHPVAHHASRPVRRVTRLAALRRHTAAVVAALRSRLTAPPASTRPVPGADVARLPMGCAA